MQESLTIEFINEALTQLKELQAFFKTDTPEDVVKIGISYLEAKKKELQASNNDTPSR